MSASIARMTIDMAFAIMADAFRADSSMDDVAGQLIRSEPNVPEGAVIIPPPQVEEQQTVRAAGIMFIEPAGSVLMLKRGAGGDYPDTWCFPGGRLEGEETSEQGAIRETIEEIGFMPKGDRVILTRRNAAGVDYTTFIQQVPEKFIPVLSDEHTGFMWFDPRPESNALSARRDAGFDQSEARASSGEWTASGGGGGSGKAAPESPDQGAEKATAKSLLDAQDEPKTTPDAVIDQFDPEVRGLIKEAETRLATATPTDAPVEQGGHKMPNGQYTAEREALHNKIIAGILSPEAIKRAKPPSGEKPTFVILGGRGGSGKSQLTREGGPVDAKKFIVFDNDKIKEQIPEYKGWNAAMVHEEATHVFERAEALAREKGLNVVHDATMKTMKNSVAFAKAYKDAGYRVEGYYMFLPPHEAAKRAVERFVRAGRYVPPSYVLGSRSNEETFDALKPQFDKWGLYDNNVPSGQKARFIGGGGKD